MTDETIKTSRASQSRQAEEKPKVWTPPNALEAPPAPDGYRPVSYTHLTLPTRS